MLRYTTDGARPGLVALYDIRQGNGAGQFLQPGARMGHKHHHHIYISGYQKGQKSPQNWPP